MVSMRDATRPADLACALCDGTGRIRTSAVTTYDPIEPCPQCQGSGWQPRGYRIVLDTVDRALDTGKGRE